MTNILVIWGTKMNFTKIKMQKKYKYHRAFTLAEVLITLGIIGIVAAMTLPPLVANYRERQFVTSAQKGYSIIVNALNKWLADNDIIGDYTVFWLSTPSTDELLQKLSTQLNVVSICTNKNMDACGGKYTTLTYKKTNDGHGNTSNGVALNNNRAVLADGMFVSVTNTNYNYGSCTNQFWSNERDENGYFIPDPSSPTGNKGQYKMSYTCGYVAIDTNGLKGPNQVGTDIFEIGFMPDGSIFADDNTRGNINYVLQNNKLIKTEHYTPGKY